MSNDVMRIVKPAEASAILNFMSETLYPVTPNEIRNLLGRDIPEEVLRELLARLPNYQPSEWLALWVRQQMRELRTRGS